jgi:GR25 family glycosyltransferase involved in LPS biosynthesis
MNYISNVYVINLDEDKDRLDVMKQQIPKLGRPFKRIRAIKGKDLTPEELNNNTTFLSKYFSTPSMIGCFLSHKKAWQTMIDNNDEYAIVMEDDCEIIDSFKQDLENVLDELIPKNPDFVYLGCFGANEENNTFVHKIQKLFLPKLNNDSFKGKYSFKPNFAWGFHFYVISNKCAQYLLKNMSKANYHVDISFLSAAKDLDIFVSTKKLGTQYSSADQSTQVTFKFPMTLNYIVKNIYYEDNVSYTYILSVPIFQAFGYPINAYIILICITAFIIPNKDTMLQMFTYFLLLEFILNRHNISIIVFIYILVYLIYRIRSNYFT